MIVKPIFMKIQQLAKKIFTGAQISAGKVLASIFWDQGGILLIDYTGQQISKHFLYLWWICY